MKTLYMVRHAKSSWDFDVIDHRRPLKKRGINDGTLVSEFVATHFEKPDQILSSDAVRAVSTAQFFMDAYNIQDSEYATTHNLYDFSGHKVMETIKGLSDSWNRVMIVGHNHAFTSIANMLGSKYIDNVPTCGFVCIEFDENKWQDITTGTTKQTVFPRDLKK